MKFVLASQNVHKQRELQAVLAPYGVELLLHGFTVLSRPASPLPLNLADKELKATLGDGDKNYFAEIASLQKTVDFLKANAK